MRLDVNRKRVHWRDRNYAESPQRGRHGKAAGQIGRWRWAVPLIALRLASGVQAAREDDAAREAAADLREIQSGVMSMADTWASSTRQATRVILEQTEDPSARLDLQRNWYYSALSMYDIAAGPYPGIAMLDMMVVASLSRGIWERRGPERYGEAAQPMSKVLGDLEEEIWSFAAGYLNADQRQELTELVQEWLADNPGARSASFIRLSDFGELGRKPTLEQAVQKGGFLSPIRDAAETAEEVKELAERALFLVLAFPTLFLGTYLVGLVRPDFAEQQQFSERIDEVVEVFHSAVAEEAAGSSMEDE